MFHLSTAHKTAQFYMLLVDASPVFFMLGVKLSAYIINNHDMLGRL